MNTIGRLSTSVGGENFNKGVVPHIFQGDKVSQENKVLVEVSDMTNE